MDTEAHQDAERALFVNSVKKWMTKLADGSDTAVVLNQNRTCTKHGCPEINTCYNDQDYSSWLLASWENNIIES